MSKLCVNTNKSSLSNIDSDVKKLDSDSNETKLKEATIIVPTIVPKKSSSDIEIRHSKSLLSSNSETLIPKVQEFDSKPGEYDDYLHLPGSSKSLNFAKVMEFYDFSELHVPTTTSTVCVVGSNPGEPKKSYNDQPTRKNVKNNKKRKDKRKSEIPAQRKGNDPKLTRGIMKHDNEETPGDCLAENISISSNNISNLTETAEAYALHFNQYLKRNNNKTVSFNSEVIIIHFVGDSRVEKTVQSLCKEQDQQARNFEFRKRYFAKYNTLFP